jgi:Zn-dependent protease
MNLPNLMQIGLQLVVLLFSVIIHEMAHGYVAWLNGDPTARLTGRITLNPIPHIDPFFTILMPILFYWTMGIAIGGARPVPVNPLNFRNYRVGEITTSAAGPASNLLLAVLFAFLLHLNLGGPGLVLMAYYGCFINILLALLNLIPIPPLDGSHLVAAFLPQPLARYYGYLEPVGIIIVIIFLFFARGFHILLYFSYLIMAFLKVPLVF